MSRYLISHHLPALVLPNQETVAAPSKAPAILLIIHSHIFYSYGFLSDFGTVEAVVDRQATDTEMYVLDKDYLAIGNLPGRSFSVSDVAPTGDATKFSIISEWCVINRAPKAHAIILGLNT